MINRWSTAWQPSSRLHLFWGKLNLPGGACGRKGRFFKEKAPQKPFWKRFFGGQWGGCEHRPPIPEGARPVFAEGKDRQRLRFFGCAHLSLEGMVAECWRGFQIGIYRCLRIEHPHGRLRREATMRRLPLLRGGSRACAGGEDEKTSALIS